MEAVHKTAKPVSKHSINNSMLAPRSPLLQSIHIHPNIKQTVSLLSRSRSRPPPALIAHSLKDDIIAPPTAPPPPSNTQPSEKSLRLWRNAQAVCFDIDCTVTVNDGLDLLAEFMGVGDEVKEITTSAMNGTVSLEDALNARLEVINPTPTDIQAFLRAHPPETRLVPGAKDLIKALQSRGIAVYLISGGFRELSLPIAAALDIPPKNLFANRMNWQMNEDTGTIDKLAGFDEREVTGHQFGKPKAIKKLRDANPYRCIVMIGDGITDLEAVQAVQGGADLFIGFGGVVKRDAVMRGADWFVDDFNILKSSLKRYTVAMVGSGAWACAAVKLVAQNTLRCDPGDTFTDTVTMWVYEEEVDGKPLTSIINEMHENVKYLPGHHLGDNVVATPSLISAVQDADIIIFCVPHQFVGGIVRQMAGSVKRDAIAISLTKGLRMRPDGPQLISDVIRKELGIDCSVLMGANIAEDIARGELSEATIGYNILENALLFQDLFETETFYTTLIPDVPGAEMCGTLKNVVALAAGFVDGLGLGPNTKAAIMRAGLGEMMRLALALYTGVRRETFLESCGVADLIASCYGGRNRLVAKVFAERKAQGLPASFEDLEHELLHGQKLQGVMTADEVYEILKRNGWELSFPLFTTVHRIIHGQLPPTAILNYKQSAAIEIVVSESESSFEQDEDNGV